MPITPFVTLGGTDLPDEKNTQPADRPVFRRRVKHGIFRRSKRIMRLGGVLVDYAATPASGRKREPNWGIRVASISVFYAIGEQFFNDQNQPLKIRMRKIWACGLDEVPDGIEIGAAGRKSPLFGKIHLTGQRKNPIV